MRIRDTVLPAFHNATSRPRARLAGGSARSLLRQLDRVRYANAVRMGRLLVLVLMVSHWTACLWHGLAHWLDGESGVAKMVWIAAQDALKTPDEVVTK